MTRVSPMPPDLPTVIQALRDRVDSLERTQPQATTPQHQTGLTFTAPTDLPIRAPRDFRAESLWADAPAAVADDTVWELRRNGTAVGTVTITAGDTHGHATLDPPVVGDVFDVFTVVRTAGSDPATVRVLGRSTSPDSPAVGGGCSPVPGGSLQCDVTTGQVATGDPLVSVNTTRTSSGFDAYFTHSDFTWTAAAACTVFVSFSALVESGGTANTLGLKYGTGPASGVSATAGDGVTLAASDLIEVAAGDDLWLELAHDGGGDASVYGARFTLLIVCTAASEPPPM